MKYFAVLMPMKDEEKSKTYRPGHMEHLDEMRKHNRIFSYGRFIDGSGGLIIYQGESLEQVTEWAKEDPFIKTGARHLEVHEWAMQTDYNITEK